MSIKILLADDHKIVRDGLRALIEKQQDMEVVAEAADGRTAVRLAKEMLPDVVIMDISMPDLNGIEAARQIVAGAPRVKIITLSMHSDSRFVKEVFKAGASGYLLKECAFEELARAIHTVAADQIYLSPRITHVVLNDYMSRLPMAEASVFSVLSAREREVLQLMAEGKTTKEIAYSLDLSVKTVEAHRQKIMEKSNIHSVAELTKYAIREGLTSLES
jgi:DNA-binding NarL/FixJ family response regulator